MTLVAFLKSKAALVVTYGGASGGSGSEPQGPSAQTDPATSVTNATAVLNGVINGQGLDCQVQFEYGPTTSYGKITPLQTFPASSMNQNVSAALKGLAPDTTYHFRIRAATEIGQTYGLDATFETYPIAGINPTVVGSVPVVTTTGATDLGYDAGSGKASARLNGTVDAGTHAHGTAATIGIRRVGTGTNFAFYNQQAFATSSITPVAFYADTGYTLEPDTDYEYIVDATNIKGNVQSAPPQQFHTTSAPFVGVPPTVNTGAVSIVTSSTALVETTVSHNNATAGTGHTDTWLRYRRTSAPTSGDDYQDQVGPINLVPLTGAVPTSYSQALTGLVASSNYWVWTFASNPYGSTDDWATASTFTTAATSSLPTIDVYKDDNWVAYGQATVFCSYTTPAAGTFTVRFGYRVNGSGAAFTYTAYESVAVSLSAATWDAVIGGLTPATSYEVIAQIYDTTNTVQSTGSAFVTTAAAPSSISKTGYQTNHPGKGPGSRGTTMGAIGQSPTIDQPTYADPRRPSSGLISVANRRKYKSNISANPTYAAANAAAFAAYPANDGYDLVVYGPGHGVGGRSNYDIEVWDPQLCSILASVYNLNLTVPMVLPSGSYTDKNGNTQTGHGKGAAAINHAVKALSRVGDVCGLIGTYSRLPFCGASNNAHSNQYEMCWVTATVQAKVIVGVAIVGIPTLGGADQAAGGVPGWAGRIGAVNNVYYKRLLCEQGPSNSVIGSVSNGGTNNGNWFYSGSGGLVGVEYCKLRSTNVTGNGGYGTKWGIRNQSTSFRYDIRNNTWQYQKEHVIYIDNPSPPFSGVEGGVAAPSFFCDNVSEIGLLSGAKTGDGKNSVQIVARNMDNTAGSLYECIPGCDAFNCANNTSIGPSGEGDLYFYDNALPSDPLSDTFGHAEYAFVGHGGTIHVRVANLTSGIICGASNGCTQIMRPHQGADGYVYATIGLIVENATTALNFTHADHSGLIKVDSCARLEVQGVTVPVGFTKPVIMLSVGMYSAAKAGQFYQGQTVINNGFVKVTMADPLSGWAGWPGGAYGTGDVRYGYDDSGNQLNISQSDPPVVGRLYTATDVDVLYAGVCRDYMPNPTLQPGSFNCPND